MSVFHQAILECLAFIAFLVIIFGGPGLLWLWICWKIDQRDKRRKRGRA